MLFCCLLFSCFVSLVTRGSTLTGWDFLLSLFELAEMSFCCCIATNLHSILNGHGLLVGCLSESLFHHCYNIECVLWWYMFSVSLCPRTNWNCLTRSSIYIHKFNCYNIAYACVHIGASSIFIIIFFILFLLQSQCEAGKSRLQFADFRTYSLDKLKLLNCYNIALWVYRLASIVDWPCWCSLSLNPTAISLQLHISFIVETKVKFWIWKGEEAFN